jgi:hypothetical protein
MDASNAYMFYDNNNDLKNAMVLLLQSTEGLRRACIADDDKECCSL